MGIYRIAKNLVEITHPDIEKIDTILPSLSPFRTEVGLYEEIMLKVQGVPYKSLDHTPILRTLTTESNGLGAYTLHETEDGYCIDLIFEEGFPSHRMVCNKSFSDCKVAVFLGEPNGIYVLDSFIMMAFSQCCAIHQTAMLHASVIMKDGKGYAFLGSSGTGKSTHSKIWLKNIPGTELLNDDNPAIRLMSDGTIHIFGTPWSGKTDCYKNIEAELVGFVVLKQAKENKIAPVPPIQAYLTLIGSSSTLRWNPELFNALGKTLEVVTNAIQCYHLENTPTPEAAWLSYKTLSKEQLERSKTTKNIQIR